jgi:hypothetical protein
VKLYVRSIGYLIHRLGFFTKKKKKTLQLLRSMYLSILTMVDLCLTRPLVTTFTTFILLWILYLFGLVFYRLYLHPLARFPGPKLAACSRWYEFFYDVVLRGQFTFQIQRMHKKYGMNATATSIIQSSNLSRSNCSNKPF